jgi:hypothetical protein
MDSYTILKFKGTELPEQYHDLVFSKFLRSLRFGNKYFKLIDSDAYYKVYNAYFKTLIVRPEATISLAVLSDDHDVVLGWALQEPKKLHYVYVNKDGRRMKIATALVEPFDVFTHLTMLGVAFWKNKHKKAKFNPFA